LASAQPSRGLYLIIAGFFKKVAIVDGVSPIVDQIFSSTGLGSTESLERFLSPCKFTVIFPDIPCTDIARGVSKVFGIDLILNFSISRTLQR
jgi:alginate O-acetyltransferase complex protein AlgI